MLKNVRDGFVRDTLLSPTIDKTNLSITLLKVGGWCEKDLENYDLPFEVVDKRADFYVRASEEYSEGNYGTCRELLINYFSV
jgi:hypothetical protein